MLHLLGTIAAAIFLERKLDIVQGTATIDVAAKINAWNGDSQILNSASQGRGGQGQECEESHAGWHDERNGLTCACPVYVCIPTKEDRGEKNEGLYNKKGKRNRGKAKGRVAE
jgi:hypothetical protein